MVRDDLPRLHRELEGGRHLGAPVRKHGVRLRFVERVLHLNDGEVTHIRRLGDRPTTQPDANVHLPTVPRWSERDSTRLRSMLQWAIRPSIPNGIHPE